MIFDLAMTDALLTTTRAVRKRLDFNRPVPRELILECLRLSVQAPTGGNRQAWRWIVVDGGPRHAAIAELYRETGLKYLSLAAAAAKPEGDEQTDRVYASTLWLAENISNVPVFVFACLEGNAADRSQPPRTAGTYGSIFPAVWSFQLALRARGLGSTLTTVLNIVEAETMRVLDAPAHVMLVAMLPVAYTQGTDFRPAIRPPVEKIVHWNGW